MAHTSYGVFRAPESHNNCCDCWHTFPLNPSTWNVTAKKVAQMAATIVGICLLAILVSGLMVSYPEASGAFFTAFSIVAAGGTIVAIVAMIKHCRQQQRF